MLHNDGARRSPADASPLLAMESIADLDKDLLAQVLIAGGHADGAIESIDVRPVGQGLLGSSNRIAITYAPGVSGLPVVVIKMHAENPGARKLARYGMRIEGVNGFYANEVAFYRDIAPALSIRVPNCYAAAISEDEFRFVLVLEAIEPATGGDDLKPCPPRRLEMAITNIAGLHGPTWGYGADRVDPRVFDPRGATGNRLQSHVQAACRINAERWADEFDSATFDAFFRFADFMDIWQKAEGRVRSVIHTDHRLDNLLFFDDREEVAVVDWQTIQLGLPLRDVGQLFAASVPAEIRREYELPMLQLYHEALARNGVKDYSFDTLLDDYRWSLFQGLNAALLGMATIPLQGRGKELFLTKLRRSVATLKENRDYLPLDIFAV